MKRFNGKGGALPIVQIAIMDALESHKALTIKELAAMFGMPYNNIAWTLGMMRCAGRVRRIKPGVYGRIA